MSLVFETCEMSRVATVNEGLQFSLRINKINLNVILTHGLVTDVSVIVVAVVIGLLPS